MAVNVNSPIVGLRVASVIFALVCLAHLARVATGVEVLVAGHSMAIWMNWVAAAVAGGLSVWLWRLSCGSGDK